ncbi:hypothetical protein MKX03_015616, partial [Papaver bracteatum]
KLISIFHSIGLIPSVRLRLRFRLRIHPRHRMLLRSEPKSQVDQQWHHIHMTASMGFF